MAKQKIILPTDTVPGLNGPDLLPESAARCTRCNACAQNCPAYQLCPQENFSPRGRMQLIRLITEGQLKPDPADPLLGEIAASCVLCARCSVACAAQLPVAHHTLALRRGLQSELFPAALRALLRWRNTSAKTADFVIRGGLLLHRLKMGSLFYPLLPAWLRHAQDILPRHTGSLCRILRKRKINCSPEKPNAVYLPSLYTQYIDPHAGWVAYEQLADKNPAVLFDMPSGLFEYIYGERTRVLQQAKKLLLSWEHYSGQTPLPFITDSIEVYGFLKNYPLLFTHLPGWQQRAEKFAAHVQFITEVLSSPAKPSQTIPRITLDSSSLLYPAGVVAEQVYARLLETYGKNLLECEYSRLPLPAAGIAFAQPAQAAELVLHNARDLMRQHIEQVYCLSGWAALELQAVLRKHYPSVRADFIVNIYTQI